MVCPVFKTAKRVVVEVSVDDAIVKILPPCSVSPAPTCRENFEVGDVVPIPNRLFVLSHVKLVSLEMLVDVVQNATLFVSPPPVNPPGGVPIQVPLTAKHPLERLIPTFEVEVARPTMLRPRIVVVPKPEPEISIAATEVVAKVAAEDDAM